MRRILLFVAAPIALFLLLFSAGFVRYVYFDRSGLPDIEGFFRFEPPMTGRAYDARGKVLIELAREYRPGGLLRRGARNPSPGDPGG